MTGPDTSKRADRCLPQNKFRFNQESGKCEDYSAEGCMANRDSYGTRDECEAHCIAPKAIENLALVRGKSHECNLPTQVSKNKLFNVQYENSIAI